MKINGDAPNTHISGSDYFKLIHSTQRTHVKTNKKHTGGIDCLSPGK